MEDSYSDFLDHFILLLAARFHAPLHTWDGVRHPLLGSDATVAWQLVSRNVQLLLSAQACQTSAEKQELKHVEPHFFTPRVCRERAMYLKWKIQKQKERRRKNRAGKQECDASDSPMLRSALSDPSRTVGGHSSFDITKDSLTEKVTSLYDAVRQHLPSSLLEDSESDDDADEEEEEEEGAVDGDEEKIRGVVPSLPPVEDVDRSGNPGQQKDSNEKESHECSEPTEAAGHQEGGLFFRPPTFHVSPLTTTGNHERREGSGKDAAATTSAIAPADEAMTSFEQEKNNIFRIPMRSDAKIERDKVIAQAKNAMLAKMQDMQARFFHEYRRWVDLPEGVMDDPPPLVVPSASSPLPFSSSTIGHPSTAETGYAGGKGEEPALPSGRVPSSLSSTFPLYSAFTHPTSTSLSTTTAGTQSRKEWLAAGGATGAVPSSSSSTATAANQGVVEMLHALQQRLSPPTGWTRASSTASYPPTMTGKTVEKHLSSGGKPRYPWKGEADPSSISAAPLPLPLAADHSSVGKKESTAFKKTHAETPKKTERMYPAKPHSFYVQKYGHTAEERGKVAPVTAGTTSSAAGTTSSLPSAAVVSNARQESGLLLREDAKRMRRLQPLEYSDDDDAN